MMIKSELTLYFAVSSFCCSAPSVVFPGHQILDLHVHLSQLNICILQHMQDHEYEN